MWVREHSATAPVLFCVSQVLLAPEVNRINCTGPGLKILNVCSYPHSYPAMPSPYSLTNDWPVVFLFLSSVFTTINILLFSTSFHSILSLTTTRFKLFLYFSVILAHLLLIHAFGKRTCVAFLCLKNIILCQCPNREIKDCLVR